MRLIIGTVGASLLLAIAGCTQVAQGLRDVANRIEPVREPQVAAIQPVEVAKVQIDMTTPDRTMRTHFAFQEAREASSYNSLLAENAKNGTRGSSGVPEAVQLFDGPAKKYAERALGLTVLKPVLEKYEREIVKVDMETETRAVVTIKVRNVTPLPFGATPDANQIQRRTEGEIYRFVMAKTEQGWKIEDVLEFGYSMDPKISGKVWQRHSSIDFTQKVEQFVPARGDPLYGL